MTEFFCTVYKSVITISKPKSYSSKYLIKLSCFYDIKFLTLKVFQLSIYLTCLINAFQCFGIICHSVKEEKKVDDDFGDFATILN